MKIGIIGASGFTGKKLFELLSKHEIGVSKIFSNSFAGKKTVDVWSNSNCSEMKFSELSISEVNKLDLVFLATPNEISKQIALKLKIKVIDLSQAHRFEKNWVYGLPEINKEQIKHAEKIANPGCFATAALLSALPLQKTDVQNIIFDCVSGISGAGKKQAKANDFNYLSENFFAYKITKHEHNKEIKHFFGNNSFLTPHVGPFKQGIMCTSHIILNPEFEKKDFKKIYSKFYAKHPFVKVTESIPDISMVSQTNNCFIGGFEFDSNQLVVVSVLDNLIKGASGQAIQNMNLMLGFKESEGLI